MNGLRNIFVAVAVVTLLLAGAAAAQIYGITNFTGVHVAGVHATATPILMANSLSGNAGNALEVEVAGTPAWYITSAGVESTGHPEAFTNNIVVSAPTSLATATPAMIVDSLAVSKILDIRDAATPVFYIANGGNWTASGVGTNSNQMIVSAPTSIATAQPALSVDSLGVSNLFEVRDAATPVFAVQNGGTGAVSGVWTHSAQLIVSAPTAQATAQPALEVDSLGVGRLFEVRDAATPVVAVDNGGNLHLAKGLLGDALPATCTHGAIFPDFSGAFVVQVTSASATPTPNDWTVAPAGTVAIIIGPTSNGCVFTKGAKMALDTATITLGPNDILTLVSDGTSWNEQSFKANATS
jgi:hypothetical protein